MEIPESSSESGVPELSESLSHSLMLFLWPGIMYLSVENLKEALERADEDLGKDMEDL